MRRVLCLLVLMIGCSKTDSPSAQIPAEAAPPAATYEILVDDEPVELRPEQLTSPGQVFYLAGYWIAPGPPGPYRFCTETGEYHGGMDLFEEQQPDEWILVGIRVGMVKEGKEYVFQNPLAEMTPEEKARLKAVEVTRPVEGLTEMLSGIDPERCLVELGCSRHAEWGHLPDLPAGLRRLSLDLYYEEGSEFGKPPPDLTPLLKLVNLRWFRLQTEELPFDLDLLEHMTRLEVLELSEAKVLHPERLADFEHLRTLKIEDARLRDLTPLSGHRHLEVIRANASRVELLPGGNLPALRELHVMGTPVSAEEVARFRAANPQCRVSHTWDEILVSQLARATRVQVVDGPCDPRPKDRLLFEVTDYQEVRKLIDGLAFDGMGSGGFCMCGSGDIALVFFSDEAPLGRMGVKHGFTRLLWPEVFPGEGQLTKESTLHLASWLEQNGFEDAVAAGVELDENYGPGMRRYVRYQQVLPARVLVSIDNDWDAEVARGFAEAYPDAEGRAAVYLRLLGVDEGSWNLVYGLDKDIMKTWLPGVKQEVVAAAVLKHSEDELVLRGAARWFLGEEKIRALDGKLRADLLPIVSRHALRSPRVINRQRAMTTMAAIGGDTVKALLGEVAAGKIKPRPLPEEDRRESNWKETPWSKKFEVNSMWDTEFAQKLLDSLGD